MTHKQDGKKYESKYSHDSSSCFWCDLSDEDSECTLKLNNNKVCADILPDRGFFKLVKEGK